MNKSRFGKLSLFFFILCVTLAGCATAPTPPVTPLVTETSSAEIECEVGIVGGGPAGIYLAYRLAPHLKEDVCLFEKEAELGGRMRDEAISDAPNAIRIGTGARRVNDTQTFVLGLAKELGIELETPEPRSQLIQYKGHFAYSSDAFVSLFPRLTKLDGPSDGLTRENEIYRAMLAPENVAKASRYRDLRSYVTSIAGADAIPFLRASSRFHGDFDYNPSAANYLAYLRYENSLSLVNHYPVGGMSMFARKMEEVALSHRVRIFKSEPVLEIKRAKSGGNYVIGTANRKATVHRLVIAAPPSGVNYIKGEVTAEIRKAPEYTSLLPIRIVVINQVWNERWWENVRDPNGKGDEAKTWRAWSSDHCVNHTEVPQEEYAAAGKVTRSVYTEDPQCVKFWEEQLAKGGIPQVEREVAKGLKSLFNHNLAKHDPVVIPEPVRTTMKVWPAGWYYVRAGSKVTNEQIAKWSIQPLAKQPELMLVGEAYWADRPGWSEGAYYSVHALLNAKFKDVIQPR